MNKIKILTSFLNKEKKISIALGDFDFIKMIGQSANGYVGEFTFNGKAFAIKFLISEETGKSEIIKRKRFIAEYINVVSLPPNNAVVQNIGFDLIKIPSTEGFLELPLIVMKKYDGTLKNSHSSNNDKDSFLNLYKYLIATVKFVHLQGIIHRDLKPENIFIEGTGYVIGDFGIAFYDPERFAIKEITVRERKERLGNRVFSAPEQENPAILPAKTMDIYAIGQILQWFATSQTHRGTGRKLISSIYEDVNHFDSIIDKCIKQDPKERFQTVDEIITYKKQLEEIADQKDPFVILEKFNGVLRKSFPKKKGDPLVVEDQIKINTFLVNLKKIQNEFGRNLWYSRNHSHYFFLLFKNPGDKWSIGVDEYEIEKLIVSFDDSTYNDFVIIKFRAVEPFIIDGDKTFYAGLVDEKHLISVSELENGYAEIEGKAVDLSKRKRKRMLVRQEKGGYFFIATKFNCVIQSASDDKAIKYCLALEEDEHKALEIFQKFKSTIRPNKPEYIKEKI